MTVDVNAVIREALAEYGPYMTIEALGQRWHTAPVTIGQTIKDHRGPGIAIAPEDALRTKYIIPTISVLIFEINAGLPEGEKLETV